MIQTCTADFLRFLAAHGIDPEVPLILVSMAMGGLIVWQYRDWKEKNKPR